VHGTTVLRRLGVVATSLALAAGMAGCADSAEPTGGLAIVVGARSNMPPPSLDGRAKNALEDALVDQSYLSIVVADGDPFQLDGAGNLLADDANAVAQKQDRDRNRDAVNQMVTTAKAKTPETDLLGALDLAARSIASQPGQHTIVVVDSGLSTVSPLDFRTPGLLDADPAELAESLKTAGELPDLHGVHVVFQGLGDTAPPQEKLRRSQRTNLVEIWTAIVQAAGGYGDVEQSPLQGESAAGLPTVAVVPFDDGLSCTGGIITLTGGDVGFKPDSADFRDREAARATVRSIAEQMKLDGVTATLTGMTAKVGAGSGVELSERRAEAVRDLLVELGVPADRLTTRGLGSEFSGYVQDRDAAGNLIPEKAQANRKVDIEPHGALLSTACS
jgi:outer membrane protein OmpA-like peptidoglycan-associated protein